MESPKEGELYLTRESLLSLLRHVYISDDPHDYLNHTLEPFETVQLESRMECLNMTVTINHPVYWDAYEFKSDRVKFTVQDFKTFATCLAHTSVKMRGHWCVYESNGIAIPYVWLSCDYHQMLHLEDKFGDALPSKLAITLNRQLQGGYGLPLQIDFELNSAAQTHRIKMLAVETKSVEMEHVSGLDLSNYCLIVSCSSSRAIRFCVVISPTMQQWWSWPIIFHV